MQELENMFDQLIKSIKRELPDALILLIPEGMYIHDVTHLEEAEG
jgi:hypothetical protein